MTMKEKFERALVARGEKKVKDTPRFAVYTRSTRLRPDYVGPALHYYVGKSGSLRTGPTSAGSVPCSKKFKDILIAEVSS